MILLKRRSTRSRLAWTSKTSPAVDLRAPVISLAARRWIEVSFLETATKPSCFLPEGEKWGTVYQMSAAFVKVGIAIVLYSCRMRFWR